MNAVGKLGSYISRSVYIVSGPFHPFGGAVDIIVVEQPDGSFKSSPWYVRFGKFQGFLQASEKLVSVSVNGVEADFHMYLDHRGEAYFLREIDVEVPDNTISPPPSVENTHGGSHSCTYQARVAGTRRKSDANVEKTMSRTDSRGSRISGPGFLGKNSGVSVYRTESMECAEIAADLLEMKWSTNLDYSRRKENSISRLSSLDVSEGNDVNQLNTDMKNTSVSHTYDTTLDTIAHNVFDKLPHPTTMEESSEIDNSGVDDVDTGTSMTYASPEIICTETHNREFITSEARLDPHDHKFVKSETMLVMDHNSPSSILARNTVRSDTQNSGNSEVELLFGDLDDFRENETRQIKDPIFNDHEKDTQIETRGSQIKSNANEFFLPVNATNLEMKLRTVSSEINMRVLHSEEVTAPRSLPNMWISDSDICESGHYINHVLNSDYFPSECTFLMNDDLNNVESKVDNDHQPFKSLQLTEDSRTNQELKKESRSPVVGNSSRPVDSSSGNWRFWPFLFRRSRSREVSESTLSLSINRSSGTENGIEDERDVPKVKVKKMKVRESTPSSAQLASLNLKEGRNTLTFTFSTPMLGKQKVDAQIHLWKWDTRIVISDVDGTITRSDLLGQVMPWVGVDWSQTGVANLFSAIKKNGYQVLFLSARAISQSYLTRQFIFNLKQDGKALPEGPVVISPDGLFPSLYREVVRRTPHEFKISCLEAIKALFPSDRNPFYAGFGNRDSDEISYLKVGIPKGKIFIINTKGEIAVNHRVDRKSYTSFHSLVDDMFPIMSSSGQEDYNSWNYWKLPINTTIDI